MFDGYDRDGLIAEYALVRLKLARDVGVERFGSPKFGSQSLVMVRALF